MTRIIAGSFGGRHIKVPERGTRPTTDRVREAVFGRLEAIDALRGAVVLDAFAGSGALGIEALSRGADRVDFVEVASSAVRVIEDNLTQLGVSHQGTVIRTGVLTFLKREGERYGVAFLDPPYDLPQSDLDATLSALVRHLEPGARVVLEWSFRGKPPTWPVGIDPESIKRYGDTVIHFATASTVGVRGTLDP